MKDTERRRPRAEPPPQPLARPDARQYAAWFRALADPTRIQIVSLLARAGGPLTVGEIVSAADVSQATVSQHLKVLAGIRFVVAERRGAARYYRLNEACVAGFPTATGLVAGREPPAARDEPVAARDDRPAGGSCPATRPAAVAKPATQASSSR